MQIPEPLEHTGRDPGQKSSLKPGDSVSVKVVGHVKGNLWKVSIKGKMHFLESDIKIKRGDSITAKAVFSNNKLILKTIDNNGFPFKEVNSQIDGSIRDSYSNNIRELLESFYKNKMVPDPKMIETATILLSAVKKKDPFIRRLITIMFAKNLKFDHNSIQELLSIISGNRSESEQKKGSGKEKSMKLKEELIKSLKIQSLGKAENDSLLAFFNHIPGENNNWIIIPFTFNPPIDIYGKISFLIDSDIRRINIINVLVDGDINWAFHMINQKKGLKLKIFCDNQEVKLESLKWIKKLEEKLSKLSVKIDDTIRDREEFDGFSFDVTNIYQGIDAIV